MRIININFGQASLNSGEHLSDAVTYTSRDRAIVRLPNRSQPDKPHTTHMVRVDGVWKVSNEDTPGTDDGEQEMITAIRKATASMKELETEIRAGDYKTYDEAVRVLTKRFFSATNPPSDKKP